MSADVAYVLRTQERIEPFDCRPGEIKVHGRTIDDTRRALLGAAGFEVREIGEPVEARPPCLLISEDLLPTRAAIGRFVKLARTRANRKANGADASSNVQAALVCSRVTERFVSALHADEPIVVGGASHRLYPLYYLQHVDVDRTLDAQSAPLPIPYGETKLSFLTNRHFEPAGTYEVPVSLVYLTRVRHWSQVLAANIQALPSHLLEVARARPLATLALAAAMPWRSGSLRPGRLAGASYLRGAACRIHPTAHVELSVLGPRVRVGPRAVVRYSVLGERTEVGAGAVVEGSTLGKRSIVGSNAIVRCCVADEEVSLGASYVQWSMFGRGSAMCPESGIYDLSLRGNVEVDIKGKSVATGNRILGGCLGEGAFLGPHVHLAAGKSLPNGCILVENPRTVVRRVDDKLPAGVWRLDEGRR